jgi:hypothetical protein
VNRNVIIGIWFGSLALVGCLVAAFGRSAADMVRVSTQEGLFINFGAVYLLCAAVAAIISIALLQWRTVGLSGFFEFDVSSESPTKPISRILIVAAYSLAALLSCYFIFVQLGRTLICLMPHDAFVYFDGAQRLAHGQLQHVDFHTPMGVLCNLIPYIGLKVAGGYAGSMEAGFLLAGVFLLGIGSYVLGTRYTTAVAIPIVLYFCLLAVIPLGIESNPELITTAMFYNRLGWTSLTLIFLFYLEPRAASSRLLLLDAACLASLLLFAFYLKVSYALVGLAFLPLMGFASKYNRKLGLIAVAMAALAMGAVELVYGIHQGYIDDLRMTLQACGANRGSMAPKFFANIREYLLAALAVALVVVSIRKRFNYLILSAYIAAAGLAIIDQNTHVRGVICLIALFAISAELIRRHARGAAEAKPASHPDILKSLACLALLLIFVIQPIAYGCAAMTMIRSVLTQVNVDLPGGLNGMAFPEQLWSYLHERKYTDRRTKTVLSGPAPTSGREAEQVYMETVLDGVEILQNVETSGQGVIVFDFVTPFSFILNLEPPEGGHTCIHYGRTISENSHPPADDLLGSTDYIMVPRAPIDPVTTDFLVRTYGSYMDRHFTETAHSKYWTLWSRAGAAK